MYTVFIFAAFGLFGQCLVDAESSGHSSWNYENPNKDWCLITASKCCPPGDTGRQTPIDLLPKTATVNPDFLKKPLAFSATYTSPSTRGITVNNGHTVQVTIDPSVQPVPTVTGGPLGAKVYQFAQLHFHWGPNISVGSEHTLNGKSYPMEVHLVHFNQAYGSLAEAAKNADGLAVLGAFYDVAPYGAAYGLDPSWALRNFLPQGAALDKYVSYQGSLTTPTCNEVVTWVNFLTPKAITRAEVDFIKSITKDNQGNTITENFRPVQPLNGRKLYASTAGL